MKEKLILSVSAISAMLSAVFLAVGICLMKSFIGSNPSSYSPKEEWLAEMQVGYSGTFASLVDEVQAYIDSTAPFSGLRGLTIVRECSARKVSIAFVLAQGEVESCFGTKGLARKTNSVWNVGVFDTAGENELYRYSYPDESVPVYVKLIDERYLNYKTVEDLLENFVNDRGERYASDLYYESKINIVYNKILESTRIQQLQDRLEWYLLRL